VDFLYHCSDVKVETNPEESQPGLCSKLISEVVGELKEEVSDELECSHCSSLLLIIWKTSHSLGKKLY
jgi:hypothetical protein